jgi:hypothetical protein
MLVARCAEVARLHADEVEPLRRDDDKQVRSASPVEKSGRGA